MRLEVVASNRLSATAPLPGATAEHASEEIAQVTEVDPLETGPAHVGATGEAAATVAPNVS